MALEVRIYDNNLTTPTLLQDVSQRVSKLSFSTQLNGGFKSCEFTVSMSVNEATEWLSREGKKGYHFNRVTVRDELILVWEGRIMDVQLHISGGDQSINIIALGYWSACQDQFYAPSTDWTSGSNHFMHEIVAEILTNECPDISTNHNGLEDADVDLAGINISAKEYPQKRINDLTRLSSSDHAAWFFAIWDDRRPYLFKRNITEVDWHVWLDSFMNLRLDQSAFDLRNSVIPVAGTTDGTAVDNAASLTIYPRREVRFRLPTSTPAASSEDAATMFAAESALPRQNQAFEISGKVYRATAASGGRLEEVPKYFMRAGEVIRIQDLMPASAGIALDDVRTFFIMETNYNAAQDTITVQPDRRRMTVSTSLAEVRETDR